jgi:hypothetical protein
VKKVESHSGNVHVMKMTPAVAAALINKAVASLRMPYVFPPETRLYLQEFNGGPTGRADICKVIGRDGDRLVFERPWGWHQGAPEPPGLPHLTVISADYPILDEGAL